MCGDLNVAHEEIDLKNPKTNRKNAGFTDEERSKMTALLDDGFMTPTAISIPIQRAFIRGGHTDSRLVKKMRAGVLTILSFQKLLKASLTVQKSIPKF